MKWILLALMLTVAVARAEGPDQDYIHVYGLIEQGDTLASNGNERMALELYREAAQGLKRLQTVYPTWNQEVLKYRLDQVNRKIQGMQPRQATNSAPASTPKTNSLLDQVRALESENARLRAQLKGSNSKPAGQSGLETGEDASALREKISALEKERNSFKAQLDQTVSAKTKKPSAAENRDKEIQQLRARLEAIEARPAPFTPQELAMFRQTPPQLAPVEPKPVKKSKELPPGSGPLVAQAERAFAGRRLDEAEQKYLQVLRQDENNVYILGNLAATQLEMNHIADAEKNIKAALQVDPEDAFSLTLLGIIKFRQNNYDEALDLLSRAAAINPQNAETQNYLGITLSQKGQRAAAEAALRKAVQLQPNYAGAHHNLAVIYATQRPPFLELARWHYDRALSLGHPKNPELEKILAPTK